MVVTTLPVRQGVPAPRTAEPGATFPVWSVTKVVLATQVLALADAGRLRLDEAVARWSPGLPGADRISVEHLLTHRSGLPDYGGLAAYRRDLAAHPERAWDDDRYLALLADGPVRPPGRGFAYSNLGYLLLRRIVEAETGLAWADAVVRDVLAPAGLDEVRPLRTVADVAALTAADLPLGGRYDPGWVAHGLLGTDVEGLARLLAACLAGPAQAARRAASLRPVAVPPRPHLPGRPAYGYGVMGALPVGDVVVLGHGGGGPGSVTGAYVAVDRRGDGIVVAGRRGDEDADALEADLATVLAGRIRSKGHGTGPR